MKKQTYAEMLRLLFHRYDISYLYTDRGVFMLTREDEYGDLFHLFSIGESSVTGFCLFSWKVPADKISVVCSCLSVINRELNQGHFYFDFSTSCIAYCNTCHTYPQSSDDDAFVRFVDCTMVMGLIYQDFIYQALFL